jgi:predicted enzyme related to lactoylglutathione lyase
MAMANPFNYCELHTTDAKKARAFYSGLFDWKLKPIDVPGREYHEIDAGEGFPGGLTNAMFEGISGWLTYVRVDDCKGSTQKARELGAQVVRDCIEIPDGTFSVLRDPLGAPVGIFQPRKR